MIKGVGFNLLLWLINLPIHWATTNYKQTDRTENALVPAIQRPLVCLPPSCQRKLHYTGAIPVTKGCDD